MQMTEASRTYFGQVAGEWDSLRAGYFDESVREAAIARAYLRPEMVVADVGSGTGFMAAGLAPLVSRVYVLDGSSAMLDVARKNLARYPHTVFRTADGLSLPLEDGSVDVAFANMYLHHCPDPEAAIRELVRILKPGGRLVLTDLDAHTHEWLREEMADEWLGFDRAQVRGWLRNAGLVNVLVDCTGDSCCAETGCSCGVDAGDQSAEISIFVATGSRSIAQVRQAVQANYGALATSAGSYCCGAASSEPDCGCSCCGPEDCQVEFETGYPQEQSAEIPPEAAELALGCGNPLAMALLQPGQVVLDIGSGGGIDAFHAARRVGPTGRVIGLDMTQAMIDRATQSARTAGFEQVEFRLGYAEEMPIPDGTVDVVLSNCVINLCEDKGRVFEEAHRVLREGGRLSISDVVSDGPLPAALRQDLEQWAECVTGALPEREYLDLISQAGFQDVTAIRSKGGGEVGGVHVYSLSVSAFKGVHASQGSAEPCCGGGSMSSCCGSSCCG
jgi:arsenite methyltransferase